MAIIDGKDFNDSAMKYWSVPKGKSTKDEMINMIYSGNFTLARKIDGNWLMVGKDSEGNLFTRARNKGVDGTFANKIEFIPHIAETIDKLPNGTVLLGEIYLPSKEQSRAVTTILGCLKEKALMRQEKGEKLNYYIFDCLAYNDANISQNGLVDRVATAASIYDTYLKGNPYIQLAEYITNPAEMEEYIAKVLENGGEGVVIQRKDNPYEWGKRTAHHSLKVKKEVTNDIDCYVTGNYKPANLSYTGKELENWKFWVNERTGEKFNKCLYEDYINGDGVLKPITKGAFYGWAGAIEFGVMRDGKEYSVCWISNIPDKIKEEITVPDNEWYHRVAKINAMMIEKDTKKLRHAKIAEWRAKDDKSWDECNGNEIFGM